MISRIIQSCVSRRSLIRGLAVVPFVGVAASTALAAKLSQKSVAYQDTPKGAQKCSGCKLFQAPGDCTQVEGTISPNGWCHIYVPKA